MTNRKPGPTKNRKDIGEVEFPIEKLKAARASSASCIHVEAALESDSGLTNLIKDRSRSTVRWIEPK